MALEYTIVKSYNMHPMQQQVQALLLEGWEPLGGIAVDNEFLYQAMSRKTVTPRTTKKKAVRKV